MDQRIRAAVYGVVIAGLASVSSAAPYSGTITETGGNVTFRLPEAADEVIVIRDGVPTSLGALGFGSHSFARSGAVNYSIVVRKGAADGYQTATAPNIAGLLQISDDLNPRNNFDRGLGVVVNNNPATPALFGRIHVSAPRVFLTGLGRSVSDGIYINNPDGSDAVAQGDVGLTAGLDFVTGGNSAPFRLALDRDGFVYISDWSDAAGTVYRTDANVTAGANILTGQGSTVPIAPSAGLNHGSIGGLALTGTISGGDLRLWTVDEDLDPDGLGPPDPSPWQLNSLWRYDIGGTVPTSQLPTLIASNLLISDFTPGGILVDLSRGPDGKFYMTQNRNDGNETGLAVVDSSGLPLYTSLADSQARGIDGNPGLDGIQDAFRLVRNSAVSPDGRWLALSTGNAGDIIMVPLLAGMPDLPNRLVLDAFSVLGGTNDGIGFDAAGNVTTVNRSEETLRTFSPGGLSLTAYGSSGTFAMDPSYTAGAGNYSSSASWLVGVVPNGVNHVARFAGAGGNVNMDVATTLGAIKFDTASNYTLSGSNTITLQGGSPNIISEGGNQTISAPLLLKQSTGLVAKNGVLTISDLSVDGAAAVPVEIYTGGDSVVAVNKVVAQALHVVNGRTRIIANGTSAATSNVKSLTISGGTTPIAKLDVTNNAFVVDYTPPLADAEPFDTIKAQIISAYANGAWTGNGITSSNANSSTHGIGYAEASALTSVPAIFGTVDATAILFRLTRYGDANLDGIVNLGDFNRLAANFGSTTGNWSTGDFNYDMTVNLQDFNRLAANFGLSASPGGPTPEDWSNLTSAIPEPSSLTLLGLGAIPLMRRRRR